MWIGSLSQVARSSGDGDGSRVSATLFMASYSQLAPSLFKTEGANPTASLILLDNRLTEGPAAGTAWQDENQSARETNSQGGDGIRYVAL